MKIRILLFLLLTLSTTLITAQNSIITSDKNSTSYKFHYEDLENFRTVLEVMKVKGDTLSAIKEYFSNGSIGMKAWINRYNVSPERIMKTVSYFPDYYQYLSQLDARLKAFENQISTGLDGLKKIFPHRNVHIPPIYYFILFGGGGSVELTANMISLDYFGYYSDINESEFDRIGGLFPKGDFALAQVDLVPQIALHETVHLFQIYIQGTIGYSSIYREEDKRTLEAFAIREGAADFLTFLGAGIVDEKRNTYGDLHEKELWTLFEPLLNEKESDHPGWFSGRSEQHPDWPWQIGYYMGSKIVEYYYETSKNKEDAITMILKSNQKEDFEKFIVKYKEKWN